MPECCKSTKFTLTDVAGVFMVFLAWSVINRVPHVTLPMENVYPASTLYMEKNVINSVHTTAQMANATEKRVAAEDVTLDFMDQTANHVKMERMEETALNSVATNV